RGAVDSAHHRVAGHGRESARLRSGRHGAGEDRARRRDLLRWRLRLRRERRRAGDCHRVGAVPRARPRPAEGADGLPGGDRPAQHLPARGHGRAWLPLCRRWSGERPQKGVSSAGHPDGRGHMARFLARFSAPLPIDAALPELTRALGGNSCAVLVAPPGAGKTTRVPLVLADEPWAKGKTILVLEPRRLAARAAAARMATTIGENVGDTVGYRVRFGSKVSARTRIEVVTEGIFTRLVLDDPTLDGVAAVLFDEFHER